MVQLPSSRDSRARKNFQEAMNARNLEDLKLTVQLIREYTQKELMDFFFSMCDWVLNVIIKKAREINPDKPICQIMKEYYARIEKKSEGKSLR